MRRVRELLCQGRVPAEGGGTRRARRKKFARSGGDNRKLIGSRLDRRAGPRAGNFEVHVKARGAILENGEVGEAIEESGGRAQVPEAAGEGTGLVRYGSCAAQAHEKFYIRKYHHA